MVQPQTIETTRLIDSDLVIRGGSFVGPGTDADVFEIPQTSRGINITIEDATFTHCRRVVNFQAGKFGRVTLKNCRVNNCGIGLVGSGGGVSWSADSVFVESCEITETGRIRDGKAEAIKLHLSECGTVHVVANTVRDMGGHNCRAQLWGILVVRDDDGVSFIERNLVEEIVSQIPSGGTEQVSGIACIGGRAIVTSNAVNRIVASQHNSNPDGIYLQCRDSIVAHNLVCDVSASEGAINLKGVEPQRGRTCLGTVVESNRVTFTKPQLSRAVGVNVASPGVAIRGNRISGAGDFGIVSSQPVEIEANSIYGMQTDVCYAVYVSNSAIVRDNDIHDIKAIGQVGGAIGIHSRVTNATGVRFTAEGNRIYNIDGANWHFGIRVMGPRSSFAEIDVGSSNILRGCSINQHLYG